MDNDIKIWKVIDTINKKLDKELLCIPLCYGINIKYIQELIQVIEDNEKIKNCIIKRVSLPFFRYIIVRNSKKYFLNFKR